jgi:hypothetical protein
MTRRPTRILGVYDADGGLSGEIRYVIGHLLGTAECSLCDITHSPLGRRRSWDRMVAALDIPFDLRHRNELTGAETEALEGLELPVVVGLVGPDRQSGADALGGSLTARVLLDRAALQDCAGDVGAFHTRLERTLS